MSGAKKFGLGVYTALAMNGAEQKATELMHHPLIQMLDVVDDSGNIDIDKIHNVMSAQIRDEKLELEVPLIGTMKFSRNDLDKLHQFIDNQY